MFQSAVEADGQLHEPVVATKLPGPRSAELLSRQAVRESNARTYPRRLPLAVARAAGSYVDDLDGNVFIDFLNGAGSLPLGHSHPELIEAAVEQLRRFSHGLDFPTEVRDAFVEAQMEMLPGGMRGRTKVAFCGPTGANAVEAALKLCKTATGRSDVIAFHGSYHGGSHGAMAVSSGVSQRERIANQMPGVHFFPYPDPIRSPLTGAECAEALGRALRDPLGGVPLPAAVILEVVQGEGGVVCADSAFLTGVREITRDLAVPLIVDEIQCGCGRTGSWFSFEPHGIEPDVIVMSKALGGGGMPASIILYDESLDAWSPGAHTGTFRGFQPAFAAGLAALRIIQRDAILDHVRAVGSHALAELRRLAGARDTVIDARGVGLMLGLELADPAQAVAAQRGALERGLIVELGGRDDTVLRLLPPLNVTRRTMDQALEILEQAIPAR